MSLLCHFFFFFTLLLLNDHEVLVVDYVFGLRLKFSEPVV